MTTDSTDKLTGRGGPGRGQGRKPAAVQRLAVKAYPTPTEKAEIEAQAKASGLSVSEYLLCCFRYTQGKKIPLITILQQRALETAAARKKKT